MELLLMAVVLHALCLPEGQVVVDASSGDENAGEQSGLHMLRLSQGCSGTPQTLQNNSWVPVIFKHQSLKKNYKTAQQVCTALDCGGLLQVNENKTDEINTCLTDCIIRDSELHNCTAATLGNCSEVMEVNCEHQVVRLVDGPDACAGRVELLDAGRWGTVCDDEWSTKGGNVVCAQLGCGNAVRETGEKDGFGPGTGPIHITKLNCTGNESNIWNCSQKHVDNNYCGHKEDAGVVCSGSTITTATPINTTEAATTNWTTDFTTVMSVTDYSINLSAPVWGCIALSVALLLVLLSNAALCKHYRRKNACVIHQRHLDSHTGVDGDINNLQAVTAHPVTVQIPMPGETQARRPSHDDSETSSGSDYEHYSHYCVQSLSNANNLQTLHYAPVVGESNQAEERLCKEENAPKNTPDDGDSDSTSSGECYENIESEQEQLLNPDGNQIHPEHSLQMAPLPNTSQSANRTYDGDSDSTSSGECYENIEAEEEQLSNPVGNQFHPEHSLQAAPAPNTSQSANRAYDGDSDSTSSGECYENIEAEPEQLLNPVGNQFHPEHSVQAAPAPNTSQSANRNQEWSDTESTSSDDCYENVGMEAEAFVQTFEGSPSHPEQKPLGHHTAQPTGNSNIHVPVSPNQDDSSTSSDDTYENVPDIDEDDCQSSSSHDYDDVSNW